MLRRLSLLKLSGVLCLLVAPALALPNAPATGAIHTPDVDLAYEVYGAPTAQTPVIAVNGGPGLSHIYMIQNDVWTRLARGRPATGKRERQYFGQYFPGNILSAARPGFRYDGASQT